MKAYVAATGIVFGLLVVIHLWRAIVEGVHLFGDPWYAATTLVAALLFGWAIRVWRALRTPPAGAS